MDKKRVILIGVFVIFIGILFLYKFTGFAVFQQATSVSRTISKDRTGTITVTLKISADSYALGISEQAPSTYTIQQASSQGVIKGNKIEWLFAPGKSSVATYTVKSKTAVPTGVFTGTWYTTDKEGNVIGISSLR